MELCNLGQADLVRSDMQMYDEETDRPCTVKSGNLLQELGQISHIFSDKTGTLTRNEMKLVKLVVGAEVVDVTGGLRGVPDSLGCARGRKQLNDLLEALVVCHTVVKETLNKSVKSENSNFSPEEERNMEEVNFLRSFRAESPDELALILGAKPYGYTFDNRNSTSIFCTVDGTPKQYEVLATNVFNADRKRMSVLLRNTLHGNYSLVCKGADNVMLPLIKEFRDEYQKTLAMQSLKELANEGLRTLVVGRKELTKDEAEAFLAKYKVAANSMNNREENLAAVAAEIELELHITGITAIEDRLQDEVPSVIEDLAKAGVVFWMLTGDKKETAISISSSCNLIMGETRIDCLTDVEDKVSFADKLRGIFNNIFPEKDMQYSYWQDKAAEEYKRKSICRGLGTSHNSASFRGDGSLQREI